MGPARTGAGTQPLPVLPGLESPGVPAPREQVLPPAAPGPRSLATSAFRTHFPSRPAPRRGSAPSLAPPSPRPALPPQPQSGPSPSCGRGNRGWSRSRVCAPGLSLRVTFPPPVAISLSLPISPHLSVRLNLCPAAAPPLAKPARLVRPRRLPCAQTHLPLAPRYPQAAAPAGGLQLPWHRPGLRPKWDPGSPAKAKAASEPDDSREQPTRQTGLRSAPHRQVRPPLRWGWGAGKD